MLGFVTFKFDGDFFSGGHVRAQVYITKGTTSDFTPKAVPLANAELHDGLWKGTLCNAQRLKDGKMYVTRRMGSLSLFCGEQRERGGVLRDYLRLLL